MILSITSSLASLLPPASLLPLVRIGDADPLRYLNPQNLSQLLYYGLQVAVEPQVAEFVVWGLLQVDDDQSSPQACGLGDAIRPHAAQGSADGQADIHLFLPLLQQPVVLGVQTVVHQHHGVLPVKPRSVDFIEFAQGEA